VPHGQEISIDSSNGTTAQQQMSNLFTKLVCKKEEQMGIQKQLVK